MCNYISNEIATLRISNECNLPIFINREENTCTRKNLLDSKLHMIYSIRGILKRKNMLINVL